MVPAHFIRLADRFVNVMFIQAVLIERDHLALRMHSGEDIKVTGEEVEPVLIILNGMSTRVRKPSDKRPMS